MSPKSKALARAVHTVVEQLEHRRLLSSTLISGDPSITANTPYTLTFNAAAQGAGSTWSVNWGDGSSIQSVSGTATSAAHQYASGVTRASITATVDNLSNPLDTTFGASHTGKVITDLGSSTDQAEDVVVQPDGKIVAAGGPGFSLVRYNADGSVDTTFGTAGKAFAGLTTDHCYAVALQADGKIVAAGGPDFKLVRFNANGTLDSTFGSGGIVNSALGSKHTAYDVTIRSDGKIVAVGNNSNDVVIARYLSNGQFDTGFSGNGHTSIDLGGFPDHGRAVTIQPDGKFLITGRAGLSATDSALMVMRTSAGGNLDTTFGTGGVVKTNLTTNVEDVGSDVTLQSDGKIVVTGRQGDDPNANLVVLRYTTAGALDSTFGSGGYTTVDFSGSRDLGKAVRVLADGKILVAGRATVGGNQAMALVRFTSNGALDSTFGSGGKVTTDLTSGSDYANGLAIDANGEAIVAGSSNDNDFALARYQIVSTGTITAGGYQAGFNFGPDGAAAAPGYITDIGNGYRLGSSGYNFGWIDSGGTSAKAGNTFERDTNADQRLDTGIDSYNAGNARTWEAAVPNGTYYVTLVAGDANVTSGTYNYNVENVSGFLNGSASGSGGQWVVGTGLVTVADNKLTISNGGGSNHELDYVEITDAGSISRGTVAAPLNVVATAVGGSTVDVRWRDNSDNETSFLIERATNLTGAWTSLGTAFANGGLFTDSTATPNTTYYYRVTAVSGLIASAATIANALTTPAASAGQVPYDTGRTPWTTGTNIQAEDFDTGGEDVSYNDTTLGNAGGYYRSGNVDVGLNLPNNRYFVGWTRPGEWTDYTVNVPTTGTYIFDASVAADSLGGQFGLSVGGNTKASGIQVPNTTAFTTYQHIAAGAFSLSAGNNQIVRLTATADGQTGYFVGDVDWLKLSRFDAPTLAATPASSSAVDLSWASNADPVDGYEITRRLASSNTWSAPITVAGTATSYQDTGLTAGTAYVYRIRAIHLSDVQTLYTAYSTETSAATTGGGPTIAIPPAASATTITGTTVDLSVLGADASGESNLKYTWSATLPDGSPLPAGVNAPTFSHQGDNTAKNTTAIFSHAGDYRLAVTISNGTYSTTAGVNVTVNQTLNSIVVTPGPVTVAAGATQQFTAMGQDQFGQTMLTPPSITWSVPTGSDATISPSGLYTAGTTGGSATVTATSGSVTGSNVNPVGPDLGIGAHLAMYINDFDDGAASEQSTIDPHITRTYSNMELSGTSSVPKLHGLGNETQNITISNLPPHESVSVAVGITRSTGADGTISVQAAGSQLGVTFQGGIYDLTVYSKEIADTDGTLHLSISGQGFAQGQSWNIANVVVDAITPGLSIHANKSSVSEGDTDKTITYTMSRSFQTAGSLTVPLIWGGTANASDTSSLPSSVTIEDGQSQATFTVDVKDDQEAEWTESLSAMLKDDTYHRYGVAGNSVETDVCDNDASISLSNDTLIVNNNDSDNDGAIDLNDTDGVANDPELYPVTLKYPHTAGGTVTITWPSEKIRLWKNAGRTDEITGGGSAVLSGESGSPTTLYAEAISRFDGVKIQLQVTDKKTQTVATDDLNAEEKSIINLYFGAGEATIRTVEGGAVVNFVVTRSFGDLTRPLTVFLNTAGSTADISTINTTSNVVSSAGLGDMELGSADINPNQNGGNANLIEIDFAANQTSVNLAGTPECDSLIEGAEKVKLAVDDSSGAYFKGTSPTIQTMIDDLQLQSFTPITPTGDIDNNPPDLIGKIRQLDNETDWLHRQNDEDDISITLFDYPSLLPAAQAAAVNEQYSVDTRERIRSAIADSVPFHLDLFTDGDDVGVTLYETRTQALDRDITLTDPGKSFEATNEDGIGISSRGANANNKTHDIYITPYKAGQVTVTVTVTYDAIPTPPPMIRQYVFTFVRVST